MMSTMLPLLLLLVHLAAARPEADPGGYILFCPCMGALEVLFLFARSHEPVM
jgi:hypothetical protein